jgi:large subunit ribosomal protein L3
MTQLHAEDGTLTGVTVISAGPCVVCQVRTQGNDGYDAVQLGFENLPDRLVKKPQRGHFKKGGVAPMRFLREERLSAPATASVGDVITTEAFSVGDVVDVIGITKGHGFAGTIKRHNFSRGPETHGSMNVRAPGSIATRRLGAVPKGKRMPGHFGVVRQTTKNLRIVRIDTERGLVFVAGAVPGANQGLVQIQTARTARKKVNS